MRFGYWMPIFGGWLRNVRDEGMSIAWPYLRDLAIESEQHGFDLSLIALDRVQLRFQLGLHLDVFTDEAQQHLGHVGDDGIQVEGFCVQHLLAAKC